MPVLVYKIRLLSKKISKARLGKQKEQAGILKRQNDGRYGGS